MTERVSGSRLCVMRKRRAPTTIKTRIAENASWSIDTLVKPPRTRRTSERPSAPIDSLACPSSWPLTHLSNRSMTARAPSSVLPASSLDSLSKAKTTLEASMKNMTETNCTNKTAVSGAGARARSVPTFPAKSTTRSATEARVTDVCFFASIPYNPTDMMTSTKTTPSPRNTWDGIPRTIQGTNTRWCNRTVSIPALGTSPRLVRPTSVASPRREPLREELPQTTAQPCRSSPTPAKYWSVQASTFDTQSPQSQTRRSQAPSAKAREPEYYTQPRQARAHHQELSRPVVEI